MATIGSSRIPSPLKIAFLVIAAICVALPFVIALYAYRSEPSHLVPGYDPTNLELDISRLQIDPVIAHIERTKSDAGEPADLRWFGGYLEKAGPASRANFEKACAAVKYSAPSGYCSLIRAN